jgi:chemotaxis protein methyltransferase CheR
MTTSAVKTLSTVVPACGPATASCLVPGAVAAPIGGLKAELLSAENYKFLQEETYRESGIVLDQDKHYLLESRLGPILRSAKLATLDDLCIRLRTRSSPELTQRVMEALTTNETLFFRDMAPFDALKKQILPELLSKLAPSRPLEVWSAAASSGQEAYSIAMLLEEQGPHAMPPRILGTDISEQILDCAREAKYVQFEVNRGLPALYLVKYFNREGLDWRLKNVIREMVKFQRFDLRQPMRQLGRFHIIFCRNVLIYFDQETKSKILKQIATVLEPGGYLLLGGAESIMNLQDCFERVANTTTAIYRRK